MKGKWDVWRQAGRGTFGPKHQRSCLVGFLKEVAQLLTYLPNYFAVNIDSSDRLLLQKTESVTCNDFKHQHDFYLG